MHGRFLAPLAAAFLLVTASAWAADIECDGCSLADMQARALAEGSGQHRVYSFSTGVIHAFRVACSGAAVPVASAPAEEQAVGRVPPQPAEACPPDRPLQVREVPLDTATAEAWPVIMKYAEQVATHHRSASASAASDGRASGDIDLDARLPGQRYPHDGSVYAVLGDYPARTALLDDLYPYFAPPRRSPFSGVATATERRFTFRDGTSIVIRRDPSTRQLGFVRNSARQPDGVTPIVEANAADYAGTHSYGGAQPADYDRYLRDSVQANIVPGGRADTIACQWGGERRLTCKIPERLR